MAGIEDVWPEDWSPFRDLEPAFREPGDNWVTLVVQQEPGESREAFRVRVAARKRKYPPGTKLRVICLIDELARPRKP